MSLTYDAARDEILGMFQTAWAANAPAVAGGTAPKVEWPGVDSGSPPKSNEPWARIVVRHTADPRHTLAPAGLRRFQRAGLVTVSIFAPFTKGGGFTLAEQLAIIARDAYEGRGTPSGIWFRNARIVEVGREPGGWFQMNVLVEFRYEERR